MTEEEEPTNPSSEVNLDTLEEAVFGDEPVIEEEEIIVVSRNLDEEEDHSLDLAFELEDMGDDW